MTATTQLITGVDFVALPTRDLEPALEFYGSTLGLRRSAYPALWRESLWAMSRSRWRTARGI